MYDMMKASMKEVIALTTSMKKEERLQKEKFNSISHLEYKNTSSSIQQLEEITKRGREMQSRNVQIKETFILDTNET